MWVIMREVDKNTKISLPDGLFVLPCLYIDFHKFMVHLTLASRVLSALGAWSLPLMAGPSGLLSICVAPLQAQGFYFL